MQPNPFCKPHASPRGQPLRLWAAWSCAWALLLACSVAAAAPLSLSIINPDRIGVPGGSEIFAGTITNNTGSDLNASDLFLNFAGYDAANVSLTQLLGLPDFVIADASTSAIADLFRFDLAASTPPATYYADVVVEDINNNFSDPVTVSVTVPEPGSLALSVLALVAGGMSWRRRDKGAPDAASSAAHGGRSC